MNHDIVVQEPFDNILFKLQEYLKSNKIDEAINLLDNLLPADRADLVEELDPEDQVVILTELAPADTADVFEEMQDDIAVSVAENLTPEQLAVILDAMENDEAADVLGELDQQHVSQTLRQMEEPEDIVDLMKYPPDTAGGLMTTLVITLSPGWTVEEALDEIRRIGPGSDSSYYLYVIDHDGILEGIVGLRDLVSVATSTRIRDLMETNVVSVLASTDQEECARTLARYSYLTLPVIDELGRLLGVITADDLVEVAEEEVVEDMYRMVGITGEERISDAPLLSIAKRLPWLAINLVTLFIAISVIDAFEEVIAGLVVLSVFLPVVSGEGGNAGSQTATVIVRGIALGELGDRENKKALTKELIVAVVNGIIIGLLTGGIAYVWKGNTIISISIFIAMVFNFIMAAAMGVLVPLILRRLNIDPALASAAFVTGFTDTFGFLFFLGIVTLLI